MNKYFLGIDTGSVSLNTVVISEEGDLVLKDYRRTRGRLIEAIQNSLQDIYTQLKAPFEIGGLGVTGSGRQLTAALTGADLVKNEITAHTTAVLHYHPEAQTLLEIGGEDSKLVVIQDGLPVDFAMNTLCAAGTGAFMDQLAHRLGIPVEELGDLALKANKETAISGRCTVFAESDIIFKQQAGVPLEDIVKGLCRALVRNYLQDTGHGKPLKPPFVFQGGVAANKGIRQAFNEELEADIIVPENYDVMGALGMALLIREQKRDSSEKSSLKGWDEIISHTYQTESFPCDYCENHCAIVSFAEQGKRMAAWGGRCERWSSGVSVG